MKQRLQRQTLYGTRRDVRLEPWTVLNLQTSQQPPRLTWVFIVPRSRARPSKKNQESHSCSKHFRSFYSMQLHGKKFRGENSRSVVISIDCKHMLGDVDNHSFQEELERCKHLLVYSKIENGRHRFFNFAIYSLNSYLLIKQLSLVFYSLKCAAEMKKISWLCFRKMLRLAVVAAIVHTKKKRTDGTVWTRGYKKGIEENVKLLKSVDLTEICTRTRANTKWKIYKLKKEMFCCTTHGSFYRVKKCCIARCTNQISFQWTVWFLKRARKNIGTIVYVSSKL